MFTVYGARGTGSVAVEAALTLIGAPYRVVEIGRLATDPALAAVNPLRQAPTLALPSGEVLTESAAILIWLADTHPRARLSPGIEDAGRPAFLRWMAYVASLYALWWVRDDPSRLTSDPAAQAEITERTAERAAECWRIMDAQVPAGRYILGGDLSVLDLYVAMISRWGPRRKRFYREAPRMAEAVRRVDADPRLQALWAERFPFEGDWEG